MTTNAQRRHEVKSQIEQLQTGILNGKLSDEDRLDVLERIDQLLDELTALKEAAV